MKRLIVEPAPLPVAARDELKRWLAISAGGEDDFLDALLRASFDLCEAFTGIMVLVQTCEEYLPASCAWQALGVRPVRALVLLASYPADGPGSTLAAGDYALDIDGDQIGRIRLARQGSARRLQVRYQAGLATSWDEVPEALRQGIIRLAAHHYRERDGAGDTPPASVAALWRPWRRLRLA